MMKLFSHGKACLCGVLPRVLACSLILAASSAIAQPTFTGGRHQTAHVCDNSNLDLTTLLSVNDPTTGVGLTWTVINSPAGFTSGVGSGSSSGGAVSPSVFTYIPLAGSTSDLVSVIVSDGTHVDTTDITISVTPISAVSLSAADATVCPGSTTMLHIEGPAGALITYNKLFDGTVGPGYHADTFFTVTLDGAGHASILLGALDPNTGGEETTADQMYYYAITSATASGCSVTDPYYGNTSVNASYIYAHMDHSGPMYMASVGPAADTTSFFVCSGWQDTIHLIAPPGAVAVVRKHNMLTSSTVYDTVTISAAGMSDVYTGPITEDIYFDIVYISSSGCERFVMDRYYAYYKVFTPVTIASKNITENDNPAELEIYHPANAEFVCYGTYRHLVINVPYAEDGYISGVYWGTTPGSTATLTYSVNGGPSLTAPLYGEVGHINTASVVEDLHYTFTQVTTQAGCVVPIYDTFLVHALPYPTATLSATPSICAGSSGTITVTGTPDQPLYMTIGGVDAIYNTGSTGVVSISTGTLTSDAVVVLHDGYDTRDALCLSYYHDTATVIVNAMPAGTAITSAASICTGGSLTLSASTSGGSWTVTGGHTSLSGGVLTGVSAGTDMLTYIVSNSCGADTATQLVTVVPDIGSAITISPATTDVCPGETAMVNLDGPAGTVVTYMYELQDLAGTTATGIFDSVRTITIDATGHAVIPVVTTDEHSGETSELGYNFTRYYYTLMSASLGSCSASFTPDNSAMVSANYVAAYWENLSARAFRTYESAYWNVCSGAADTLRLNTPGDAVVVVSLTNMHTMAVSYDTIIMPHTGMYDIHTGPVTDSINYTVVAITSAGCDKILMDDYSIRIREVPHNYTLTTRITSATAPDDYLDVYPEGPVSLTCIGTHRIIRVEVTGTSIFSGLPYSITPQLTYTINGGTPENVEIGTGYYPDGALINTGLLTTSQHYYFISVTDDMGCVVPVSDSFNVDMLVHPTASIAATSSVCAGESVAVTITGTPTQVFNLIVDGVNTTYAMDTSGVFVLSSGTLMSTTEIVLANGFYEHSGDCMTDYYDTITLTAVHAPSGTSITSASSLCVGSSITLTGSAAGGSWSLSNANASISGDVLTGVTAGTDTLTYIVSNSCGSDTAFQSITVNALPFAGVISGADTMCQTLNTLFTTTGTGGTWTSANTAIATVNALGRVYGVAGGLTTISYTVSSAECGSVSTTHDIYVRALATPVSISGPDTVCAGSSISLNTTGTTGYWFANPSIATIDAAGNLTGVSAGITPVIYRVDVPGCDMAADTLFITVVGVPTIGIVSGADTICEGASTVFSVSGMAAGAWTSSNTTIATVNALGSVYGVAGGSSTISYTVSSAGCGSATATHDIYVRALATPVSISGPDTVCVGSSISLSTTGTTGYWFANPSIATIDASGNLTGVSAGITPVIYRVDVPGCDMAADTMFITVNAVPVVAPITGTTNLCAGAVSTLAYITAGGVWSSDNVAVASVDGAGNVMAGIAGTATVTYSVTNIHGCSSYQAITLTVNDAPVLSAITGPLSVAVGASATYTDTATGGTWSSSNTAVATVDAATGEVSGVAEGLVTITYTKTNGAGCSSFVTMTIAVAGPLSSTTISPTGTFVLCHGEPVTLGAIVPGGTTGVDYQWYVDGVAVPGATNSVYMATTPGAVSVVVSNAVSSYTVTGVTVVAGPSANISLTGTNTLYTGSFSSYQWYLDGAPISGATASIYNATVEGMYAVVVTDGTGCTDTSDGFHFEPVGVGGPASPGVAIAIYPNPATSVLHIDAAIKVDVKVLAVDGKLMLSATDKDVVDMSGLSAGLYMVMVYDKNGHLLKAGKIVKKD